MTLPKNFENFQLTDKYSYMNCIYLRYTQQLQNVPGITLLQINTKRDKYITYISFKTVPFCNYTLLPKTVKCWKLSWKPFV